MKEALEEGDIDAKAKGKGKDTTLLQHCPYPTVSHPGKGKGKKSRKEEEKGEDAGLEEGDEDKEEEKENKKRKIEKNGMISDSDEEDQTC